MSRLSRGLNDITCRYCFGGACAARLGAKNLVDSIVINHPGGLSLKEVGPIRVSIAPRFQNVVVSPKLFQVPTSWVNAEGTIHTHKLSVAVSSNVIWTTADDAWFNADLQLKAEAIFAERTGKENFVEYEFKQWKGPRISLFGGSDILIIYNIAQALLMVSPPALSCQSQMSKQGTKERSSKRSTGSTRLYLPEASYLASQDRLT